MENKKEELGMTIENLQKEESMELTERKTYAVTKSMQSTLDDKKLLFNLNDHVDFKLNDKEGEEIDVHNIVVKTFEKVDEETGEITKSIVTILLDKENKSYVTASKFFAFRVKELMECYKETLKEELEKGIKIKITKNELPDNPKNKYLSFNLL